jgi:multidrug efflux pump subunit AcrB
VLLFFLGTSNSMFVGISIPSSMLLSFIILRLQGVSMNMVVLFSLILALGMLVDNAIVVVENIYRFLEQGWSRTLAAKKATGEVALPVIASTLTTLAAFAPLLFWPGIVGEFMGYLPLTLIVTLSSSLFMALVIVPTLCALFMRRHDEPRTPWTRWARWTAMGAGALAVLAVASRNPLTAALMVATVLVLWAFYHYLLERFAEYFQRVIVPLNLRWYEGLVRWALDHRVITLGASFLGLVVALAAFGRFNAGLEFFPEDIPPNQIFVDVELPVGTRADATDVAVRRIEEELRGLPGVGDVESVVAVTGSSGAGGGAAEMTGQGGPSGPDMGRITVSLVDYQDREFDAFGTLEWMQAHVGKDLAGAEITVEKPEGGPQQGAPVNVEIVGEDPAQLQELSDRVLRILRGAPVYEKLVGLESDLDAARPEISVRVDRERAALYDLSTSEIGRAIRGAINGIEAAKYRTGNDEYDITVRLAEPYRNELENLRELTVVTDGGRQIPLPSIAEWRVGEGYGSIRRKDQTRMATISSDVAAGLNSNAVLMEVQQTLAAFAEDELPLGYTIQYTGQSEEQAEAQEFLTGAFITALMLIGFILVSQFNSVVKPVIILTSVLLSTAGVFLGLMLFQMPFVIIMTGVGIISLAGIVVNNAIVLIDYIDILRARDGMNRREALVRGGMTRFRPVVLTATTTALGLVPLAVGLNFDFFGLYRSLQPELYWGGEQAAWWGPMAIAVIAGILFATFLTLVLVPVMYSLVDDVAHFFRTHYTHTGAAGAGSRHAHPTDGGHEPGAPTAEPMRPEREPAEVFREGLFRDRPAPQVD